MSHDFENLSRELEQAKSERDYFKRHADELLGASMRGDYEISTLRHKLQQRQQGFALLSELQRFIGSRSGLDEILCHTSSAINALMGMDKTFVLTRGENREYSPAFCRGAAAVETFLAFDESVLANNATLIFNRAAPPCELSETIRATFDLPFFILQSVAVDDEIAAVFLTGRMTEKKPFVPPLDEGDADTLCAIAALIAAFVQHHQSAALRIDNAELRHLATIDKLTGISNRRHFEEMLMGESQRALRHRVPLSLILLDVDHFKKCNDTYGHDVGDAILQQFAARLTAGLRPGDFGARWGGEEFIVLLPETAQDGAVTVAERIRLSLECAPMSHRAVDRHTTHTASFGVATLFPGDAHSTESLIARADAALYEAKRTGRNRVCAVES